MSTIYAPATRQEAADVIDTSWHHSQHWPKGHWAATALRDCMAELDHSAKRTAALRNMVKRLGMNIYYDSLDERCPKRGEG